MSVGTLLSVFGFLPCRAAAVSSCNVLFLSGFGLHLAVVFLLVASTAEVDAVLEDVLKVVHRLSDGTGVRR